MKNYDWMTKITSVETKGDGSLQWVAEISGSAEDRDQQSVNQATLKEQWDKNYKHNPIVVYMHSWLGGIGHIKDFDVDTQNDRSLANIHLGKGFKIPTVWGTDVHVDDIAAQIKQKVLRSHSIGFAADIVERKKDGLPDELLVRDWFETSVVTIPSYRRGQIVQAMAKGIAVTPIMLASGAVDIFPAGDPLGHSAIRMGENISDLINRGAVGNKRSVFEIEDPDKNDEDLIKELRELEDILRKGDLDDSRKGEFDEDELAMIVSIGERFKNA